MITAIETIESNDSRSHAESVIKESMSRFLLIGKIIGVLPFGDQQPFRSKFCRATTVITISAIYLLSTVLMLVTVVPPDGNLVLSIETVFPSVGALYYLTALISYWSSLRYWRLLSRKDQFFDLCRARKQYIRVNGRFRRWRLFDMVGILMGMSMTAGSFTFSVLMSARVIHLPVVVSRVTYWLKAPEILFTVAMPVVSLLTCAHLVYSIHFVMLCCDLLRLHVHDHCQRMEAETNETFQPDHIDFYHADYIQLSRLSECLDQAFKGTSFVHVVAFVFEFCLNLYFMVKGSVDFFTFMNMAYFFVGSIIMFIILMIPTISLNTEFRKPTKALRLWFLKHQLKQLMTCGQERSAAHLSMVTFMQTLDNTDNSITIASLSSLNPQFLATISSVLITYFLLIYEFSDPGISKNSSSLINDTKIYFH